MYQSHRFIIGTHALLIIISSATLFIITKIFIADCGLAEQLFPWAMAAVLFTAISLCIMIGFEFLSSIRKRYKISKQKIIKYSGLKYLYFERLSIASLLTAAIMGAMPFVNDVYYLEGCTSFYTIPIALPTSLCIAAIVASLLGIMQVFITIIKNYVKKRQ